MVLTISSINPSSAFGSAIKIRMVVSKVLKLTDGNHDPFGRIFSVSICVVSIVTISLLSMRHNTYLNKFAQHCQYWDDIWA